MQILARPDGRLTAVLLAAALLVSACDKTKAVEAQAQTAVAHALPDSAATSFDLLHTDVAADVVCGTVTAGDAGEQSPFIVRKGVAKVYRTVPSWSDIRLLTTMDSGSDQAAVRFQIDDGCDFPAAWTRMCAPVAAPVQPPDPELCRLWKTGQFRKLFDHVKQ